MNRITLIIGAGLLLAGSVLAEDEMRDFYAEPGMNPFRTSSGQDVTENIDPFSGNLQLSYVDLSLPGNGGLDINITRYYNLPQSSPAYGNPFGYGWTMHFGRITIGSGHASQLCGGEIAPGNDTLDNPSIEMPDGGRELLVRSSALSDGSFITKSNWKAACIDSSDYKAGIVASAPDGTEYHMREYVYMQGEDGPAGEPAPAVETWLTNTILDVHGNRLDLTYLEIASGMKLLTRIDASDGRRVVFQYLDPSDLPVTADSTNARLHTISADNQTWRYEYGPIPEVASGWGAVHHYKLSSVVRPDGTQWTYQYGDVVSDPSHNRLTAVTYPAGGIIHYTYQWLRPYLPNPSLRFVAIRQKSQVNPGHDGGTWIWDFFPGHTDLADLGVQPLPDNAGRMADLTRITTPVGEEQIYHVGYWALVDTHNILWQMGLKLLHRYFQLDAAGQLQLLRSTGHSWDKRPLSDEVYRGGALSALWDEQTYAPVIIATVERIDGYTYITDYADHDDFGNAGKITEYAIYPGEGGDRIKTHTFFNDTDNWIIGLPLTETIIQDGTEVGAVIREYNASGQLTLENRYGVNTHYTYSTQGDLATVTDALGHTTTFSDYFRGIPTREDYADNTFISRTVNGAGTVASITSARGHTTRFNYDGLNRIAGIDYPLGDSVSIIYSPSGKTLSRGNYQEEQSWDGFGRLTSLIRRDLGRANTYKRNFINDAMGRTVFESDINASSGIHKSYDAIDRLNSVTYQDGSQRVIEYDGAHRELHTDENGILTEYLFQVYGSPEQKQLSWILSPEGVGTRVSRDALGNITAVFQGGLDPDNPQQYLGYTQDWIYNSRLQLIAIDSPADIGLTSYGRDALGNMTSKQIGNGSAISYSYDQRNRLSVIDYQDDTLDTFYQYDAEGRLISISNGNTGRSYERDANGNLVTETLTTGSVLYSIYYTYNSKDHLTSLTYPSGRIVDYAPDAMGRPTQAMPYLNAVSYFPNGNINQLHYANGRVISYGNTLKSQIDTIDAEGLISLDYDYDPVGNVISIANALDPTLNRTMGYDSLNRLTSASGPWGNTDFTYDAFSNLTRKNDPTRGNRTQYYHYLGLQLDRITYSDSIAQRIFSYDESGNISYSDDIVIDPISGWPTDVYTTRQHAFNDAGNMVFTQRTAKNDLNLSLPLDTGSLSSHYDGKGQRVRKINHSDNDKVTDYFYSDAGLLLGEYGESGQFFGNEYFYLGRQQIATAKHNAPPVITAESEILSNGGNQVDLAATYTDFDGEVVSVSWEQISGPTVAIDDSSSEVTFFQAPYSDEDVTLLFSFTAIDDRGAISATTVQVSVTATPPPARVTQLAVLPGENSNLIVWEPVAESLGYNLYWSTDPTVPTGDWIPHHTTTRSFLHQGLTSGVTYYYTVAAISATGETPLTPVVSATATPHTWQESTIITDLTFSPDPDALAVGGNGLGEFVIVDQVVANGIYQLRSHRYSPYSGWDPAEIISGSTSPHQQISVAMDKGGNLLAAWIEEQNGTANLYASYRPLGMPFSSPTLVEHYDADDYVDGRLVGLDHLEFADSGEAFICWRQNRLHTYKGYYMPDGASAMVARFHPDLGWHSEHQLEIGNNVGDTRSLSCDVSSEGHVAAAWGRYNTYDPQLLSLGGYENDVWVAAYHPDSGWSTSETVEYLQYGIREPDAQGIQNIEPRSAANSDSAAVIWHNRTDTDIEFIEYDFASASWQAAQVLESRNRRLTDDVSHALWSNGSGDLLATWGQYYSQRNSSQSGWSRSQTLPDLATLSGINDDGWIYSIHQDGSRLLVHQNPDGSWMSHELVHADNTQPKSLLHARELATGALQVFWGTGSTLLATGQQADPVTLGDGSQPDTTPPVTSLAYSVSRIKGAAHYLIELSTDEPAITEFRFSGQVTLISGGVNTDQWQQYNGPVSIQLDKKGSALFEYFSVDTAGNREDVNSEALQ